MLKRQLEEVFPGICYVLCVQPVKIVKLISLHNFREWSRLKEKTMVKLSYGLGEKKTYSDYVLLTQWTKEENQVVGQVQWNTCLQ